MDTRHSGSSKHRTRSIAEGIELSAPTQVDAHRFKVGSEEFVLISFPVPAGPSVSTNGVLTESEREICALVVEGRSNVEIAAVRGTSPRTIANQIAGIYRKLRVGSRRELRARRAGAGQSA